MEWFTKIFEKFAELQPWAIVLVAVLAVGSVAALIIISKKSKKGTEASHVKKGWNTKMVIIGALCIALAFVLSYVRIIHMPQGGSITLASMLPIMMFAYIYGTPKGLVVALAYSFLQMLQDMYIVHWAQAIMDYTLAFMSLALAGLFKKSIFPGVILSGICRYIFHVVSGIIFFASYAPNPNDLTSVLIYSASYNSVVLIELVIIIALLLVVPQLRRFMNSQRILVQ